MMMFPLFASLLVSTLPLLAQVESVSMRTTGISCGVCAMVSEINFKRMEGVEKVTISLAKESILLTYKPGAAFSPQAIRQVLQPLEVGVVLFRITARGHLQEQGGKRYFIAGKDRFVVAGDGKSVSIATDTPVLIEGRLNDLADPMEVKILDWKPLKP